MQPGTTKESLINPSKQKSSLNMKQLLFLYFNEFMFTVIYTALCMLGCYLSVSYTHLDVYKRQVDGCLISVYRLTDKYHTGTNI